MKDRKNLLGIIISIVALVVAVTSIVTVIVTNFNNGGDVQYVMYVGTNDQASNQPLYPSEEAKKKVEDILVKHFSGYTIQDAYGGWTDDNGNRCQEYTVVVYLSYTTIDKVHKAADELSKELNQGTILIQTNKTTSEFYEPSK